jgi:hypothetical protein
LRRAVADGSFDEYFYNHELIEDTYKKLNFAARRIIYLCSPHHRNPKFLNDTRYWLRPWPADL